MLALARHNQAAFLNLLKLLSLIAQGKTSETFLLTSCRVVSLSLTSDDHLFVMKIDW